MSAESLAREDQVHPAAEELAEVHEEDFLEHRHPAAGDAFPKAGSLNPFDGHLRACTACEEKEEDHCSEPLSK